MEGNVNENAQYENEGGIMEMENQLPPQYADLSNQ